MKAEQASKEFDAEAERVTLAVPLRGGVMHHDSTLEELWQTAPPARTTFGSRLDSALFTRGATLPAPCPGAGLKAGHLRPPYHDGNDQTRGRLVPVRGRAGAALGSWVRMGGPSARSTASRSPCGFGRAGVTVRRGSRMTGSSSVARLRRSRSAEPRRTRPRGADRRHGCARPACSRASVPQGAGPGYGAAEPR